MQGYDACVLAGDHPSFTLGSRGIVEFTRIEGWQPEGGDSVAAIRLAFAEAKSTRDALYGPGTEDNDWATVQRMPIPILANSSSGTRPV